MYIYIPTYIYVSYLFTYIQAWLYIYIHIYTHIITHTYICIYIWLYIHIYLLHRASHSAAVFPQLIKRYIWSKHISHIWWKSPIFGPLLFWSNPLHFVKRASYCDNNTPISNQTILIFGQTPLYLEKSLILWPQNPYFDSTEPRIWSTQTHTSDGGRVRATMHLTLSMTWLCPLCPWLHSVRCQVRLPLCRPAECVRAPDSVARTPS